MSNTPDSVQRYVYEPFAGTAMALLIGAAIGEGGTAAVAIGGVAATATLLALLVERRFARPHHQYPRLGTLAVASAAAALVSVIGYRWSDNDQSVAAICALCAVVAALLFDIILNSILVSKNPKSDRVGWAATSVLVVGASIRDPGAEFLLVFNRNLRGGLGLWVSPGGHFDLTGEMPDDALIAKVRSEVGLDPTISNLHWQFNADPRTFSSTATEWLPPPMFLLNEDLHGKCSQGHERHIDFVYICHSGGATLGGSPPKYSDEDVLRVSVASCAGSFSDAERAVFQTLDARGGRPAAFRDDVPRDVIERLHLVSDLLHRASGP